MHYRRDTLSGSLLSEADGPAFFLSPAGKSDPRAELEATIVSFFGRPAQQASPTQPGERKDPLSRPPVCRFPARLMWLSRQLPIDLSRLPVKRCPDFEKFLEELQPQSVTLVFSSYYLNNPASAFGHTFLRFNKSADLVIGERRELLDYGIDFSADVDTSNALIYAFKGLSGAFPGTFKRLPYYFKVREYNDYESRDLWEYKLDLSPEQVLMLAAHVWELGSTYFNYYYISENCSYHILALLEVANPELELVSQLTVPVIPAETVKALERYPQLIEDIHLRPSLRSQFRARIQRLGEEQKQWVERLAADPSAELPSGWSRPAQAEVFDAAADLIDVIHARDLLRENDSEAAERKQHLLARRASLKVISPPLEVETPEAEAPHEGHDVSRAGVGVLATDEELYGTVLDFRLALHDLADPSRGYPDLSQIEFMALRLEARRVQSGLDFELENFSLVRVRSYTPQDRFDRQISWKIDIGAETIRDPSCGRCTAARIYGGSGLAIAGWDEAVALFGTLDAGLWVAPGMEGIGGVGWVRLGVGPAGGLRLRVSPDLIALTTARWLWLPGQNRTAIWEVQSTVRWQVVRNWALSLEGRLEPHARQAQLLGLAYF